MKAIFKYPLTLGATAILAPKEFEPLHVGMQREQLTLWALVDPDLPPSTKHRIQVYGTGWPIDENRTYIGTVLESSDYVWHVYIERHLIP
jgi:hypothetical protein